MKRIATLLAVVVLAVAGLTYAPNPPAADATAGSIYGIHVYRWDPGFKAELYVSLNNVPDAWDSAFLYAGVGIDARSEYVNIALNGCVVGRACSQPTLYGGGSSGAPVYVSYDVNENAHLVHWTGGSSNVNRPRINGDLPTTTAVRRAMACDALMRQLGVIDGCDLDGTPSTDGLAVLEWMHATAH
jgi:hypothetical protein